VLSFEQAPPMSASFRFFLTAPAFGVAAGLLLAWEGPDALASRWTPAALALTHLLTAGFLLQAMCGALLQFIPVATGANVWRPLLLAGVVHPALLTGAALLALALGADKVELLRPAELLLGAGIALFCFVTGSALLRSAASGASLIGLRAAVGALAVTTALGLLLAEGLAGRLALALPALTDLHAAWGLGGWALMLLAGVSYTVVPMFQMTPAYPPRLRSWVPLALAVALSAASAAVFVPELSWSWLPAVAVGTSAAIAFALFTLWLQHKRRRVRTDTSFALSKLAMIALLAAALGCLAAAARPDLAERFELARLVGVLSLVGVFVSAISGMLYKIVPFICSIKLPHRAGTTRAPTGIKAFVAERAMAAQMRLHFAALILLLAGLAVPPLVRPAGLVFACASGWLGTNLIGAVRTYRRLADEVRAEPAAPAGATDVVAGR
jgi:hypothetical protein